MTESYGEKNRITPCLTCGKLTGDGWNRCEAHRAGHRRYVPAPSSTARGYDGVYRKLRKRVMAEHLAVHGYWCPGWRREAHPAHDLEMDHIIPLADGGLNERRNVQILCTSCNRSKGLRSADGQGSGSETTKPAPPLPPLVA